MKVFAGIFIAFFLLMTLQGAAQKLFRKGSIYIVRHAEKENGKDPELSREGLERSEALFMKMRKYPPQLIFVSQYRRTAMTADSLRLKMNIDTVHYPAEDSGDSLVKVMQLKLKDTKVKRILVIGHTNTIPAFIQHYIPDVSIVMPDEVYDDVFVIRFKKGKAYLYRSKYGKPSFVKDGKNTMMLQ